MRVLIVKLSSLGDVVHTLPVAVDIQRAYPQAQIDWVVERSFAPLVSRCQAVSRVIPMDLRRWRREPWSASTRQAWHAFRLALGQNAYDAVLDLQGLTKSAWVSWLAPLTPNGQRYAMANRTEGSGYERPTRWVADLAIAVTPHIHALVRGREVAAQALHYQAPRQPDFGFGLHQRQTQPTVWLVHGTSRADKEWPFDHWCELGRRLQQAGLALVLPQGNAREAERAQRLAQALPGTEVLPALSLDALTERMATCTGVIGVDSGLSHIAVALDLPHVQIYNFDTAWRTGPIDTPHQQAVYAAPTPSVDAVWQGWLASLKAKQSVAGSTS
jgi:heptosyltransferase-1